MKYLILSDLHGSLSSLIYKEVLDESFDKVILLGDILYHGPRNDLPSDYNPKVLIKELNEIKDKILCIKGNCDAEVDQMVLDFKIEDYLNLNINGLNAHFEHGHHLDLYKGNADIIIYGHTHIHELVRKNGVIYFNPGSIALPKMNQEKTFAVWEDRTIKIYNINKEVVQELNY